MQNTEPQMTVEEGQATVEDEIFPAKEIGQYVWCRACRCELPENKALVWEKRFCKHKVPTFLAFSKIVVHNEKTRLKTSNSQICHHIRKCVKEFANGAANPNSSPGTTAKISVKIFGMSGNSETISKETNT